MKLSENLHSLWMQFMDVYAANTAGRKFSPEELRTICDRLSEAAAEASAIEALLPKPQPTPKPEGDNVVAISDWKKPNHLKRSS